MTSAAFDHLVDRPDSQLVLDFGDDQSLALFFGKDARAVCRDRSSDGQNSAR